MKIELLENDSIKIRLTKEDLNSLCICVDELDYANIETRRVIWTLLDAARYELKIDIDPTENMLIEVLPNRSGGCCIYITGFENRPICSARCTVRGMKPLFFDFDGADTLMSAACALKSIAVKHNQLSELYRMRENQYRLLIYPDSKLAVGLSGVLSEYCCNCGNGNAAAAYTREHGNLITGGDAISKLSAYC